MEDLCRAPHLMVVTQPWAGDVRRCGSVLITLYQLQFASLGSFLHQYKQGFFFSLLAHFKCNVPNQGRTFLAGSALGFRYGEPRGTEVGQVWDIGRVGVQGLMCRRPETTGRVQASWSLESSACKLKAVTTGERSPSQDLDPQGPC